MSTDIRIKSYGERYDDNYRSDKIAAMREMLDFLESHPEVPLPRLETFYIDPYDVDVYIDNELDRDFPSDKKLALLTKELSRNGRVRKIANDWSFGVLREFGNVEEGNDVRLEFSTSRDDVCKKVETGVMVTRTERKLVTPAVYEEVEVEVAETAWECPPILAKLNNMDAEV